MKPGPFIALITMFGIALSAQAQVKRKGTTPIQVNKKEAAVVYTIGQLNGKWQEIKRILIPGKEPVAFTDSLQMNINNGKVELKDAAKMNMSVKGDASVEAPNSLSVAGDVYSILSLDSNKLLLNDGEFYREFEKKDEYYFERAASNNLSTDSLTRPRVIDIKNISGKWQVYARKAEPGFITDSTAIIKTLDIRNISADGSASGEVTYYIKAVAEKEPCTIRIQETSIRISSEKHTWIFSTYKADGNEFIFGATGRLMYYSKH